VTTDDLVIMASEAGVLTIPPEKVVAKGRLEPGKMFMVDTVAGRIVSDAEINHEITSAHPYHLTIEMTTNIERIAVCANK
jgi:Glutamine amidotransferases class-II